MTKIQKAKIKAIKSNKMAKTVVITKQSQKELRKKFKHYGAIQECIKTTHVSRNTIRDMLRLGVTSDATIAKITAYTGTIEVKEA